MNGSFFMVFHLSKYPQNTFFLGKFTIKINLKVGFKYTHFPMEILWLLIRAYPVLNIVTWPIVFVGPGNPTTAGDDPRWLVGAVPPKKALSGALGWAFHALWCPQSKKRRHFLFFLVACRQEAHLNG